MKKVLCIAYLFPPLGGVGTRRIIRFVRHLADYGWEPIILTVDNSSYEVRDATALSQLPANLPIYRARTIEPGHLYQWLHLAVSRLRLSAKQHGNGTLASTSSSNASKSGLSKLAQLQEWLFMPDAYIGWLPFALHRSNQIIKAEKVDAILTTSAPYTSHLVGSQLAKKYHIPWIMDLRDPWVNNHFHPPASRLHNWGVRKLERKCIQQADRVITVSPMMHTELQTRYHDLSSEKFAIITNGFEADDFSNPVKPNDAHFLVRYVGSLYGQQSPLPFLTGLTKALKTRPEIQKQLRVEFIGTIDSANQALLSNYISQHQLQEQVICCGFVPHQQAIKLMQESQVQLLILGQGSQMDRVYTGKLFEYLGAKRPILAIVPPSAAGDLIIELEAGQVANPNNINAIAKAILTLYDQYQTGELGNWSIHNIDNYTAHNLTQQLAQLLDSVLES